MNFAKGMGAGIVAGMAMEANNKRLDQLAKPLNHIDKTYKSTLYSNGIVITDIVCDISAMDAPVEASLP